MASVGLLALLDDIGMLLDDVSVAAKKTAGVLGDDLALNAEQVSGVRAERELPVVWAVAKGSALNKLILVPLALLLSATLPILIVPLLMIGGGFLCYEGVHKVMHYFLHKEEKKEAQKAKIAALQDEQLDLVAFEKQKIKGAIRTDFILSAEIIVIALGVVEHKSFLEQAFVLSTIAALITVFVYGLVAVIVKIDDFGLYMTQQAESAKQKIGRFVLWFAPFLMKSLSILGTIAMFLVGGSILLHSIAEHIEPLHHWYEHVGEDPLIGTLMQMGADFVFGFISGLIIMLIVDPLIKLFKSKTQKNNVAG